MFREFQIIVKRVEGESESDIRRSLIPFPVP